jgi:tetratricopeptide (TPR) repeat protein
LGQREESIRDFAEAVRLQPTNAGWHYAIGTAYAQLGQWDKAATHAGKAIALTDTDKARAPQLSVHYWRMCYASYLLRAGDAPGYRNACKKMLKLSRETANPGIGHTAALTCLLTPNPVGDPKALLELAKWCASAAPRDEYYWYAITVGLACYRAGQFEEAARQLRQALKKWPENPYVLGGAGEDGAPVMAWLLLAMAHHRLNQGEEARLWLNKAVQKMDQELAENGVVSLRKQTHVWAMCQVLRTEAEALLKKS